MKHSIEIDSWERKAQFSFFSQFEEPFFGITVRVDCTLAYKQSKEHGKSFFLHYLYHALKSANATEAFRYRIIDGEVFLYDRIHGAATVNRPDGTFGFGYFDYDGDEAFFIRNARKEIASVRQSSGLTPSGSGANVIHFSAVPWLDFTSVSHARRFSYADSCPKITFGKVTEQNGRMIMPVAIHGHHALMDGVHVGEFVKRFEESMNDLQ